MSAHWRGWEDESMQPVKGVELDVMRLLASQDFEGVDELRAQIGSVTHVEPNCTCGCPSFTPVLDRTSVPASRFRALLPSELIEEVRSNGVPRTVIWFTDADGYIANVECVYYDETRNEWPDLRQCTVRS